MTQLDLGILLVEDDPVDAELTIGSLRDGGLASSIQIARDGAEALDFLFCRGVFANRSMTKPPRVVLLDLKLPRISGHRVLATLKADPRTTAIPVVVMTSSNLERDVEECYRLGVNSFVQKPVNLLLFQERVRNIGLYWLNVNQPPYRDDCLEAGESQ